MDNAQPDKNESQNKSHFPWRTLFLCVVLLVIALLAFKSCLGIGKIVEKTVETIPVIVERFKTGHITQTFRESIPEVSSTDGDVLEVATSRSNETFTRSDSKKVVWDAIYLGTTVSEIRVPAVFRYNINLSDAWRLAAKNNVCVVLAPAIRPSLPPAIQTDQMEKSKSSGWARFDKDDNLDVLERGITHELELRAGDADHIKLIREACRQSVAKFVRKWLMKESQWSNDRFSSIVVVFPDEVTINTDKELEQNTYEPTVKLD
jgi:hypothetical protein